MYISEKYNMNIQSNNPDILKIRELDLDLLEPSTKNYMNPEQGGSKIIIVAKPKAGKSTLLASILYAKRNIFPCAMVMSGTEDVNGFYKKIFPNSFIFNEYDEPQIEKFIQRQKLARAHLENPWAVLLLDDVVDDPAKFRRPIQQKLYKQGRHWKLFMATILQFCLDLRPSIRTSIDGVFIMREPSIVNRKKLYDNFASVIPTFDLFCQMMDQITDDHGAIYIHNLTSTNDWKDCVFWYRATPPPEDFKFGCPEYWDFHYERYNPEYQDKF